MDLFARLRRDARPTEHKKRDVEHRIIGLVALYRPSLLYMLQDSVYGTVVSALEVTIKFNKTSLSFSSL